MGLLNFCSAIQPWNYDKKLLDERHKRYGAIEEEIKFGN
jgi:hypothetical protein